MTSKRCADGAHVFEPALAVAQWIAIGPASAAPVGAATCQCGELSIVEIESGRDAHWPLWPFYVGQRTTVTDTGSLSHAFRSIVRLALESGAAGASDRERLRAVE